MQVFLLYSQSDTKFHVAHYYSENTLLQLRDSYLDNITNTPRHIYRQATDFQWDSWEKTDLHSDTVLFKNKK